MSIYIYIYIFIYLFIWLKGKIMMSKEKVNETHLPCFLMIYNQKIKLLEDLRLENKIVGSKPQYM